MVSYENDCVGPCPQGCIGSACRYRNVPYHYCDRCGEETDTLYSGSETYDELCKACVEEEISEITKETFSFEELCEIFNYSEVT